LATAVYDIVDIELSDGSQITLKPLPIKQIRKFMEVIQTMDDPANADENAAMDIFIKAAMICLETSARPELGTDRDQFENVIEIPTMMKILEICGGLKLTDPNLLGAALVGTN